MDYQKIYDSIILNAKKIELDRQLKRTNKEDYFERHHIIPKCIGGNNDPDNLVLLTAKEHFICHRLLCELYPDNDKLFYSFWSMMRKGKGQHRILPSSRDYETAKSKFASLRRGKTFEDIYGPDLAKQIKTKLKRNSHCLGKKWADRFDLIKQEQIKRRISKSLSGSNNDRYGKTWEEYYGESKAKLVKKHASESRSGCKNYMYGSKLSVSSIEKRTATRKRLREANPEYSKKQRNVNPMIKCEYCDAELPLVLYNRFHYKGRCINGTASWGKNKNKD